MTKRILLSLCLLVFLLLSAGTCSAAEPNHTMTETQLIRYETALAGLKSEIAILKQNSSVSATQLIEVSMKLQTAESLLGKSQTETKEALKLVDELRIELANLKLLQEKYEKQTQAKIKHLENENFILKVIAGIAVAVAVTK